MPRPADPAACESGSTYNSPPWLPCENAPSGPASLRGASPGGLRNGRAARTRGELADLATAAVTAAGGSADSAPPLSLQPMRILFLLTAALGGLAAAPTPNYRIYVASESGDIVSELAWDGTAIKTLKTVPVGVMPADIDGPHNVTVSPDGKYYYVSIAHGTPYGTLWKMAVNGDTLLGRAPVEMFPTTISVTPDGELAFVANSDFYGDHPRTNVVSVIYTPQMTPITNIAACDMPHGVKVNHAGTYVYVTCMNSDEVLEIDRQSLAITRRHKMGKTGTTASGGHDMTGPTGGAAPPAASSPPADCMPTF